MNNFLPLLCRRHAILFLLIYVTFFKPTHCAAQCNDWTISASLLAGSSCAANGSFSVSLSGTDVPNLTNIKYGIPLTAGGFSVPLNNSSVFNNIPPGTYEVSAVADCGGNSVGRSTHITIPGNYIAPTATATEARASLNCAPYGLMNISIVNGRAPYTITFTSVPNGYTGQANFTTSTSFYQIGHLPAGNYSLHVTDACGNGTTPQYIQIDALDPATMPITAGDQFYVSCTSLYASCPYIVSNSTPWYGYGYDTAFKYTAQIGNGLSGLSSIRPLNGSAVLLPLSGNHTLKECYGQNITYTVYPPCGQPAIYNRTIPYPGLNTVINQDCNAGFKAFLTFNGLICLPITYSIQNNTTGANYGPFTLTGTADSTPYLPLGSYVLSYASGDGYNGSTNLTVSPVPGAPYQVVPLNGAAGLNNYIEGFRFDALTNVGDRTIELFSGPPGYSYVANWSGQGSITALSNQTPVLPGTLKFPAGNYVWKITDKCGSYLLPVTVGAQQLYQFTAGIDHQKLTCAGLWIWPTGTATNLGASQPVTLSLLKNGQPVYAPNTSNWPAYIPGDSILINAPGVYTLVPSSSYYTLLVSPYPNVYTQTYSFTYSANPVQADINKTQGFLCKGSLPGQAEIYVAGAYGVPFNNPVHYKYYLAHQGNGVNGPYIATNTTGIFTGFGGNANDVYDVKIEDSCGATAVQQIKILDLQTVRAASSSHYVTCMNNSIQLSAIYLPNAVYSWTGPNGFTANVRQPVISNAGPQQAGVYHVTIISADCSLPVTDSTILTVNNNPPKPLVSLNCAPPTSMTVTNPSPGVNYSWLINVALYGTSYTVKVHSDSGYTLNYHIEGSYAAIATDTTTGCISYSDSLYFAADPNVPPVISIYSPHLQLCPGDTTMLVVQSPDTAVSYQWLLNGAPIPGATGPVYMTGISGTYRLQIQTSICRTDTSAAIIISPVSTPVAVISGSLYDVCAGTPVPLQANSGAGYSYTWALDGTTIPGAFTSSITATQSGNYTVVVSNNGCAASSSPYHLTVYQHPAVNLFPATDQQLCAGSSIQLSTFTDTTYKYAWLYNGSLISGATTNSFTATQAGNYKVRVTNAYCPDTASQALNITILPSSLNLGPDTVVCQPGPFAIVLNTGTGYSQVQWSTGETTPQITVTHSGTYWVQAVNICGTYTDTVHVTAVSDFMPNLPADTVICNPYNTATLSVPGILQNIHWSTGDATASVTISHPGVYWVEGEGPCGMLYDTVNVAFCAPHINDLTFSKIICEGDCIQPVAQVSQYPLQYHWYFPGGNPSFSNAGVPGTVCYNTAGTYPVKLIVENAGGADSVVTQITVMSKPQPRFKDTTVTVVYKSSVTLPACATAQRVDWYKDSVLVCADCPSLQIDARYFLSNYHCVVTNGDCADSCSYRLQVIDIPHDVWLPDAFTPNNDGRNDIFHIITDNPNVLVITLSVFDRWGGLVFVSNMNNDGWDGTIHGRQADVGTYFWMLRYKILGSEEVYSKKGDVTVVR
ncbi:gliding motility-associated C-terminal domain-containing protein [Chitinophagaceae bacterium MMS25-I14]